MSDFYEIEALLPDEDRALLVDVRAFMRDEVAAIINDHWSREEFPHQVWPRMAELDRGIVRFTGLMLADHPTMVPAAALARTVVSTAMRAARSRWWSS